MRKFAILIVFQVLAITLRADCQVFFEANHPVYTDTLKHWSHSTIKGLICSGKSAHLRNSSLNYRATIHFNTDSTFIIKNYQETNKDTIKYELSYKFIDGFARMDGTQYTLSSKSSDTFGIATFKDCYLDGKFLLYYGNGKLEEESNFKNKRANGPIKMGYKNGHIMALGFNRNGIRSGFWTFYYPNGLLKARGRYAEILYKDTFYCKGDCSSTQSKSDFEIQLMPAKKGKWRYYDKSGKLAYIEKYNKQGYLLKLKAKSKTRRLQIVSTLWQTDY